MHFTRQQIWQTALAELHEQRHKITPQKLAERAAKIASDLINEIIQYHADRYYHRHGLNLLRLDDLISDDLYRINPIAWYGFQTTWRQNDQKEHALLIAQHLAILLWNRQLDRLRHQQYFNFTAEEAQAYCPAQQLVLF